jgi:hypothetical protein
MSGGVTDGYYVRHYLLDIVQFNIALPPYIVKQIKSERASGNSYVYYMSLISMLMKLKVLSKEQVAG